MYKKKTLRRMPAVTRRYARIINDLDSVIRRLKNLTEEISRLEFDSRALFQYERDTSLDHHMEQYRQELLDENEPVPKHTPIDKATGILFGEEETNEL
jgi:hypothetical protein